MEYATERITYLENKIKSQTDERDEDCHKFIEIIEKSKECFKNLFSKQNDEDSCNDSASEREKEPEMNEEMQNEN